MSDLPRCFMGYDPAEGREDEKFYVMHGRELTIYGHTVDAATKRDYPEDFPMTLKGRKRGMEFACWHSEACRDGEIGSNPMNMIVEISYEDFEIARGASWPYLTNLPLTHLAPAAAVGYVDDSTGKIVPVWDSLHGDYDTETGYEPDDPKSPGYYERAADAADIARKREKGE